MDMLLKIVAPRGRESALRGGLPGAQGFREPRRLPLSSLRGPQRKPYGQVPSNLPCYFPCKVKRWLVPSWRVPRRWR